MSDSLYTYKETAEILKVHWQSVRSYIKSGKLKAHKIGRNIRIKESDIQNFISDKKTQKDTFEIEVRFITKNRSQFEKRLLTKGARVIYQGHIIDHWFVPNKIKDKDHKNRWYESGKGYGVRIREQDNGYTGKITTTFEVKRLFEPYKHDTCIEYEMEVPNIEDAEKILKLMNYKKFTKLDKDRLIYKYKEYKVVIDDIKGFKTGIEIETITDRNRVDVIPELLNISKELKLNKSNQVEKSVTYLYMEEFAKY